MERNEKEINGSQKEKSKEIHWKSKGHQEECKGKRQESKGDEKEMKRKWSMGASSSAIMHGTLRKKYEYSSNIRLGGRAFASSGLVRRDIDVCYKVGKPTAEA